MSAADHNDQIEHPSLLVLLRLHKGEERPEEAGIRAHIDACELCLERLADMEPAVEEPLEDGYVARQVDGIMAALASGQAKLAGIEHGRPRASRWPARWFTRWRIWVPAAVAVAGLLLFIGWPTDAPRLRAPGVNEPPRFEVWLRDDTGLHPLAPETAADDLLEPGTQLVLSAMCESRCQALVVWMNESGPARLLTGSVAAGGVWQLPPGTRTMLPEAVRLDDERGSERGVALFCARVPEAQQFLGRVASAYPLDERGRRALAAQPDPAWTPSGCVIRSVRVRHSARPASLRELAAVEQRWGKGHEEVARAAERLARMEAEKSDLELAFRLLERGLEVRRALAPVADVPLARAHGDLGWLHYARGQFESAQTAWQQALRITRAARGPEHAEVADYRVCLALVYEALGESISARVALDDARALYEKTLGAEHPAVAHLRAAAGAGSPAAPERPVAASLASAPIPFPYARPATFWERRFAVEPSAP